MTQKKQPSIKATEEKQIAVEKAAAKVSAAKHEGKGAASGERQRMIAETAYLIAEQRGFQGDMALDDWLQAEAEVDSQFTERH